MESFINVRLVTPRDAFARSANILATDMRESKLDCLSSWPTQR